MSVGCLELSAGCLNLSFGCLDLSFGCLDLSFGCLEFSFEYLELSLGIWLAVRPGSSVRAQLSGGREVANELVGSAASPRNIIFEFVIKLATSASSIPREPLLAANWIPFGAVVLATSFITAAQRLSSHHDRCSVFVRNELPSKAHSKESHLGKKHLVYHILDRLTGIANTQKRPGQRCLPIGKDIF